MSGPACPDSLRLADPGVVEVDVDSLLHLGLPVPNYRVELAALVHLHLQLPQCNQGGHDDVDHLAYEVDPQPDGGSDISGRSLVDVTETLQIVTDVTMVGLLIRICKLFSKYYVSPLSSPYWPHLI